MNNHKNSAVSSSVPSQQPAPIPKSWRMPSVAISQPGTTSAFLPRSSKPKAPAVSARSPRRRESAVAPRYLATHRGSAQGRYRHRHSKKSGRAVGSPGAESVPVPVVLSTSPRALNSGKREGVLAVLNSERFQDCAPAAINSFIPTTENPNSRLPRPIGYGVGTSPNCAALSNGPTSTSM